MNTVNMKSKISELHQQLLSINGELQKATELLVELEREEEDTVEQQPEQAVLPQPTEEVVVLQEKINKFLDIKKQLEQLRTGQQQQK